MPDRYQLIRRSVSVHCCFEATIIDTAQSGDYFALGQTVCECFDMASAEMIADALNQREVRR